jgi:hypothetical protein
MLANKKITVVLPAYDAAQTLKQTVDEFPQDVDVCRGLPAHFKRIRQPMESSGLISRNVVEHNCKPFMLHRRS